MTLPEADDLLLFGSIALAAIGAALVTFGTTEHPVLALGVALLVFGVPSALIAFMAAAQENQ